MTTSISENRVNIAEEIRKLKNSQDPQIDASISYLFVLSGANSYLRRVREIKSADLDDDFNRMEHAIKIARKIVNMQTEIPLEKLPHNILPTIVYNGDWWQNNDLQQAMDEGIIQYPKEKFQILDLPFDEINTKGQFLSIKEKLPINNTSIGIITHAYHFPRVSRMLDSHAPLYPFGDNVKIYAFLVDRQFLSLGIGNRVKEEIAKIPKYILKGDLAESCAKDIIYL